MGISPIIQEKQCRRCKRYHPVENFHSSKTGDGYQSYCKGCAYQSTKATQERIRQCKRMGNMCDCRQCEKKFLQSAELKFCPGCDSVKEFDSFYPYMSDRRASYCMSCQRRSSNESRKSKLRNLTPEERREYNLGKRLTKYNITLDQLLEMLDRQEWKCVCGTELDQHSCFIDHDHACCPGDKRSCGKCVRGLLDTTCNTALGLMKDNPDTALALANYLLKWQSADNPLGV